MIELANERRARETLLSDRVTFIEGLIPGVPIPEQPYSAIVSNSLLHHLHRPEVLWQTVSRHASKGTRIFIADLFRPASREEAMRLVTESSVGEPEILRRDFYNSLVAAFEPEEIAKQTGSVTDIWSSSERKTEQISTLRDVDELENSCRPEACCHWP
jgi:SAM-dependent methyltransferase